MLNSSNKKSFLYYIKRDYILYLLCIPAIIYYLIFRYAPLYGITIAFKDYNIFTGIFKSEWVGLEIFRQVFNEPFFYIALKNTIVLNLLTLLSIFPLTIIVSLMLNEVVSVRFKRISQSLLYLPHFISWVVIVGLVFNMFSVKNGSVNNVLNSMGFDSIPFLIDNGWWTFTYVFAQVWKGLGWGTIIYLAALAGVNTSLYDAANIDGANKFQKIWHVTLPCISSTITIMFILSVSRLMSIGLDAPLLLQNAKVIDVSEVISTYVFKVGLQDVRYSYATAVGLFQSFVGIMLLLIANFIARKLGEEGIL